MIRNGSPGSGGSALDLWGVALHPAKEGGWVDFDTTLLHHFGQVAIADAILAVPANAQQDNLDREPAAFEDRQQRLPLISRSSLQCQG